MLDDPDPHKPQAAPPSDPAQEPDAEDLLRAFEQAGDEVARLRRELAEAESRRDAALARLVAARPPVPGATAKTDAPTAATAAPPRKIEGPSWYPDCSESLRKLRSPFTRRSACRAMRKITDKSERMLTHYLARAVEQGVLERRKRDEYVFTPAYARPAK